MLVNQVQLLYLIPLLIVLVGIFATFKAMGKNDFVKIKSSLYFYIAATAVIFFISSVSSANSSPDSQPGLVDVFLYCSYIMGIVALGGITFFQFNGFLPMIFIRTVLLMSLLITLLGVFNAFDHYKSESERKLNQSKFKEVAP